MRFSTLALAVALPVWLNLTGCSSSSNPATTGTTGAGTTAAGTTAGATTAATTSGAVATTGATTSAGASTAAAGTTDTGSSTTSGTTGGATTGGTTGAGTTTGATTGSTTSGGAPGNVRLAEFVSDATLAFDLCLTPHGTPFTSSSLGLLQGSGLQVANGLLPGQVSAYVAVAPGTYDIALMNGGEQEGCSVAYPTTGGPITIPATGLTTIALYGSLSSTLLVSPYADDPGNPLPSGAHVRLISTLEGIAGTDFGTGFGATFSAIVSNVAPAAVAPLAGADANGYALAPTGLQDTVAVRETGGATLLVGTGFSLPSNGYGSMFLSGNDVRGTLSGVALEVCDDSAGPQPNDTFQCTPFQLKALLRLVNLVTDTGALDLCVANPDAGTSQVATLAGVAAGVGYSQSSAYVPVPANVDPFGTSLLTVIAGGASCGSAGVGTPVSGTLAGGTFNTLVAEGLVDGGPYAAAGLLLPPDEERAPADVVEDGGANVRFQTGAVNFGPAQGGTGPIGNQFNAIFYSVFDQPPTGIDGSALNDGQGYTTLIPPLVGAAFAAYDPGDSVNAVTATGYDLPAAGFVSSASSIFVLGMGEPPERGYALIQIDDQAVPSGGLLPTHP